MRLLNLSGLTLILAGCSFGAEQIVWYSNGFTSNSQPNTHTGAITYGTLGGPLVGSNINIDVLQGLGVPTNSNIFSSCFSCKLNFATGNNTADTSGNSWNFSSAGSNITITGGFDLNHNGVLDAADIQPGSMLLSGNFTSPITVTTPNLSKPDLLFSAATVLNIVNNQLSGYYGVPPGYNWTGSYTQTIDSTRPQFPGAGGAGHYSIQTVAMRNGVLTDGLVVPEPTDVLLFSSVTGFLVGGVLIRRRRLTRQA